MTSRTPKPTIRLTLEALDRGDDPTGTRRLKALLKWLLRSMGFKCVRCEWPAEWQGATEPNRDDDYANPLTSRKEL